MDFLLGHSPDPDDAFMFYAMAEHKIDLRGHRFEHILQDIETLNQRALRGELHITAVSIHAYAYLADTYSLLSCGASMGDGYGPMLVSLEQPPKDPQSVQGMASVQEDCDSRGKNQCLPGAAIIRSGSADRNDSFRRNLRGGEGG